jgi:hypothetical protein
MDPELADRFVAMWVNDLTLDYTDRGVRQCGCSGRGYKKRIIPHPFR